MIICLKDKKTDRLYWINKVAWYNGYTICWYIKQGDYIHAKYWTIPNRLSFVNVDNDNNANYYVEVKHKIGITNE